ncbi:ABC transporter substrate-binding protein [Pseudoduganella umbonata]|nr:ABC transporter substrate-binding protein [Pseudoduganella umbonata]
MLLSAVIGFHTMGSADGAAAPGGPDAVVRQVSSEVIEAARSDNAIRQGDRKAILALVEDNLMPYVDFEAVTRSAVGPGWRDASPEQRSRLQAEFRTLLMRVYAGALSQVREHSVTILKSVPAADGEQQVVHTEVRGNGDPVRLDYRLGRANGLPDWKIIDVGIAGLWLVQSYRSQFAPLLAKGGPDGLLAALVLRNQPGRRQ